VFSIFRANSCGIPGHSSHVRTARIVGGLDEGGGRSFKPLHGVFNVMASNSGAAFADFDNDGDLDLVVSHVKLTNERIAKRGADG